MGEKIEECKAGKTLGALFAVIHLVWSLAIAFSQSGVQALLNWVYSLHMLSLPITVLPFNILSAVVLVVVTFVSGYMFGYAFAFIWNKMQ